MATLTTTVLSSSHCSQSSMLNRVLPSLQRHIIPSGVGGI